MNQRIKAIIIEDELISQQLLCSLLHDFCPQINILFTGKGARIFDWFKTINADACEAYYESLY